MKEENQFNSTNEARRKLLITEKQAGKQEEYGRTLNNKDELVLTKQASCCGFSAMVTQYIERGLLTSTAIIQWKKK